MQDLMAINTSVESAILMVGHAVDPKREDVVLKHILHFRRMCEEWIGGADIRIAVENTDGFRDYERRAIEGLLASGCFVLTWDIGHSKAARETDLPFILSHKDRLRHFHIHDGKENPPKNHLALGDGEIDLKARLSLADECGASCVLETKTVEALRKSVAWLKAEGVWHDA